MALFKIFGGDEADLQRVPVVEGRAYFCEDSGNFFIDTAEGRKQVNANVADFAETAGGLVSGASIEISADVLENAIIINNEELFTAQDETTPIRLSISKNTDFPLGNSNQFVSYNEDGELIAKEISLIEINAQEKLTGGINQVVGFDADGNAIAKDYTPGGGGSGDVSYIDSTEIWGVLPQTFTQAEYLLTENNIKKSYNDIIRYVDSEITEAIEGEY